MAGPGIGAVDVRIASAPCSYGVDEVMVDDAWMPGPDEMLDWMLGSGFEGTELGPPGFLGVGAILFTVGKQLLAVYLSTAAVVSAYGAAGSLVVLLMWIYFSSAVLLFSASCARAMQEAHAEDLGQRLDAAHAEDVPPEPGEKIAPAPVSTPTPAPAR